MYGSKKPYQESVNAAHLHFVKCPCKMVVRFLRSQMKKLKSCRDKKVGARLVEVSLDGQKTVPLKCRFIHACIYT